jgi:hypothetical protein
MTLHDEVVAGVGQLADRAGVLWMYQPRSGRLIGHRGGPDMLLAGPGGVAFAEIKTGGNVLDPAQITWRDMLLAGNVPWHLWWPANLWDGTVGAEILRLATPLA